MSAEEQRERLRRYIEQRRDMGESELMLDSLAVSEVMRLLGATGAPVKPSAPMAPLGGGGPAREPAGAPAGGPAGAPAGSPPHRVAEATAHSDDAAPPGEPFAAGGDSDWRATLRATGAGPGVPDGLRPVTPRRAFPAPADVDVTIPAGDLPAGIVVGSSASQLVEPWIAALPDLAAIAAAARDCKRCPLYATAHNVVPGEGNPNADMMIVGEAPGATEDETGRPFVGESGQLLTKIIEAISLRREDVFIANVIKHRPPANRNPKPDEIAACSPYLLRQIELVRPKVILTVGNFAAQTLLGTKESLGKLRGRVHEYHGVPLIVTFHPAALLRNPSWKRPTWEDVQLARRVLDRATGA